MFDVLQMSGDKGISAFPESDNLFKWVGTIDGAQGTVSCFFFVFFLTLIVTANVLAMAYIPSPVYYIN